jgi:hypothetical protein
MQAFLTHLTDGTWDYYLPTNSFCGPIELRDSADRIIPTLKPEITSPSNYSVSYSLQEARGMYLSQFKFFYRGPEMFPLPVFATSIRSELLRFQLGEPIRQKRMDPEGALADRWFPLKDYFDIKQAGEYKLTVWPKIYKRTATNLDVCDRTDLPPVSATFKWNGEK